MTIKTLLTVIYFSIFLSACSNLPDNNGMKPTQLTLCPNTPNCINSQQQGFHNTAPFIMKSSNEANWNGIVNVIIATPRTTVIEKNQGYLHVEVSSLIFRFTDDLELLLNANGKTIDIRSASRLGFSDMGANSRRVESLRSTLKSKNLID
jgi:uncharacterized protein (DUF1499 family)